MKFIENIREFLRQMNPVRLVLLGYLSYILFGWILLSLPVSQINHIPVLDNLFTATSAISTTGLSTITVGTSYSFFGELIILLLIQLGGIGYMTFGSFVILSNKKQLSPDRARVSSAVFSLPKNFRVDKFINSVVSFTFIIELIGAIALYFIFRSSNSPYPIWSAIFHSISAFCTAGFSIYSSSFELLRDNFWLNFVISILSYCGAIGFIVFVDIWRKMKGKTKRVTLTSRIILHTTLWISFIGTIVIFISEPSIQQLSPDKKLIASFFQAMTALTTVGFNTIPIATITKSTMLLITMLMVIGASPSGTGGGLKSTTFSAMIGVMKSVLKGKSKVFFWRNEIPFERVWSAIASLCFYITFLTFGIFLLTLTENFEFDKIVFESASALGTVGLSMGITSDLTNLGKLIITFLMFVGRLGPLTFGMALFLKSDVLYDDDERDLAI